MAESRAADLPEGSIVANDGMAWIKGSEWWYGTGVARDRPYTDSDINWRLTTGAVVLRVGTGREG